MGVASTETPIVSRVVAKRRRIGTPRSHRQIGVYREVKRASPPLPGTRCERCPARLHFNSDHSIGFLSATPRLRLTISRVPSVSFNP
jgi:hypothetical protein